MRGIKMPAKYIYLPVHHPQLLISCFLWVLISVVQAHGQHHHLYVWMGRGLFLELPEVVRRLLQGSCLSGCLLLWKASM